MFQAISTQVVVYKQDAYAGYQAVKGKILDHYVNILSLIEFNHIPYGLIFHRIQIN